MSAASLVPVIRNHVTELKPDVLHGVVVRLNPHDYGEVFRALCDLELDYKAWFKNDPTVPRGCYQIRRQEPGF